MDLSRLERGEIVAVAGGVALALAVFLTWYDTGNVYGQIDGRRGHLSAWDVLQVNRFLLLAAAVAPVILVYVTLRGHALSWPRGELTAVIALVALTLVLVRGLIIKPGAPSGQIHLHLGWYLALAGSLAMLAGAAVHRAKFAATRKPPGVF